MDQAMVYQSKLTLVIRNRFNIDVLLNLFSFEAETG